MLRTTKIQKSQKLWDKDIRFALITTLTCLGLEILLGLATAWVPVEFIGLLILWITLVAVICLISCLAVLGAWMGKMDNSIHPKLNRQCTS